MKNLSRVIAAMNETHRVYTHEMSGHIHLINFCMEEISSSPSSEHKKYLDKIGEGVMALEDSNNLWKSSTSQFLVGVNEDLKTITEKSQSLCLLYSKKIVPTIRFDGSLKGTCCGEKAFLLSEGFFAAFSILARMAFLNEIKEIDIKIIQLNEKEHSFLISCEQVPTNEELYQKVSKEGEEESRSLRRFNGLKLIQELGTFDYDSKNKHSHIKVEL